MRRNLQHSRAELQPVDPGEQTPDRPAENPTTAPERVTLRDCFRRVSGRRSWSDDTRNQHESLVKHWERWFSERDLTEPDIREIRSGMFREFAEWRGWDLQETNAHKNKGYWETLLKSQMVRMPNVKDGLPPDEAILNYLPDHGLPPKGGTKQRRKRKGEAVKARQWEPFNELSCSRLIDACEEVTWPVCPSGIATTHQIWCAVWTLEWYFGMTMEDCLLLELSGLNFDQWKVGTITYDREKTMEPGGPYPMPKYLRPLLEHLVRAANAAGRHCLFPFPANCFEAPTDRKSKSTNRIYKRVRPMYRRAGLVPQVKGGRRLWFHSWRSAAVTKWRQIDPELQEYMTAHSPTGVSKTSYAVPDPDKLIPAVESYPVPDALTRMVATLD